MSMDIVTIDQTPANATAKAASDVQAINNALARVLDANFRRLVQLVWNNPNAAPQDVLNQFGPNAGKLFQASALIVQLLNMSKPADQQITSVVPSRYTYTVNADGTVTVANAPAPAPAQS